MRNAQCGMLITISFLIQHSSLRFQDPPMAYGTNGNTQYNDNPYVSEFKIKEQMCEIGRRIWLKGFCAGNEGNHSYRIGDNRLLCTPTGISKGNLKPEDICVTDM